MKCEMKHNAAFPSGSTQFVKLKNCQTKEYNFFENYIQASLYMYNGLSYQKKSPLVYKGMVIMA